MWILNANEAVEKPRKIELFKLNQKLNQTPIPTFEKPAPQA